MNKDTISIIQSRKEDEARKRSKPPECACPHPKGDALTCLAEHLHTTRFNAMLLRGHGDIDAGLGGYCTCPCHRATYRSVTQVLSESGKKARAK